MLELCGICEYRGDVADAPLFICWNCADAIRRLVRIREREQQAAAAPSFAMEHSPENVGNTAANHNLLLLRPEIPIVSYGSD